MDPKNKIQKAHINKDENSVSESHFTKFSDDTTHYLKKTKCGLCHFCGPGYKRRVPRGNVTKMDIYWGLYHIHIFVFLTL